jgi:Rieske 2Fe-2S family protein
MTTTGPKSTFELLPREYYTSDEIFAQEYERIFARDWVYAGHISQFPEKGSFLKVAHGGEEVVVVRGDGDSFYAHFNVCRHRGARICDGQSGKVRSFICPYHRWSYNLDGTLKNAPQMKDGEYFDYRDYSLRTAHADVWNGMVFVSLSDASGEPLVERMSAFAGVAAKFDPACTKFVHEERYLVNGNWKIATENGLECYHCRGNHRALCAVLDVDSLQGDFGEWMTNDDARGLGELGQGQALRPGMITMSRDGSLISSRLLGRCTRDDHGIDGGIMILPNPLYAGFYVDHYWTIAFYPISPRATEVVYSWFVHRDAVEGEDFELEKLIDVGRTTQIEDNELIERTQSGVESRHFAPGPVAAAVEPALTEFKANYLKHMG